jgi:hypothetical protein
MKRQRSTTTTRSNRGIPIAAYLHVENRPNGNNFAIISLSNEQQPSRVSTIRFDDGIPNAGRMENSKLSVFC